MSSFYSRDQTPANFLAPVTEQAVQNMGITGNLFRLPRLFAGNVLFSDPVVKDSKSVKEKVSFMMKTLINLRLITSYMKIKINFHCLLNTTGIDDYNPTLCKKRRI